MVAKVQREARRLKRSVAKEHARTRAVRKSGGMTAQEKVAMMYSDNQAVLGMDGAQRISGEQGTAGQEAAQDTEIGDKYK